ncbi:MAG TPA: ABC-F family ATP-binding cassette domain-containing protein [Kiritimatiellia bacterium]|nr:ABC-F family ATP-binding cassette domain-containing protein [Kiritimatiellia bacterium]
MIEFRDVSKHFGEQDVLVNASFRILVGDRVGVVGPNGAGKSTLFSLITGALDSHSGSVLVQPGLRLGYLRQVLNNRLVDLPLSDYVADAIPELRDIETRIHHIEHQLTLPDSTSRDRLLDELGRLQTRFEQLGGYRIRADAESALGGLGFSSTDLAKPLNQFSGGWQMRAELARVLIASPDALLLDEPSNYLDLPAVEWLQRYLRAFAGTLLLISHDRYLLNTLTTKTLEINAGRATMYHGPYDDYTEARISRIEQLAAQKKNLDQKKKQIERFVERFRAKASKASQVQSRIKMLEKLDDISLPEDLIVRGRIRLAPPPACGAEVLRFDQLSFSYDQRQWIFRDLDLSIQRGDKAAVTGHNGLGKSTLLKLMAGALPLTQGQRTLGHHVVPGYQSQDFAESMNPTHTVLATVKAAAPEQPESALRTLLGGFGFTGSAVEKTVSVLSGGEKIRLAFARLLVKPPNLLLLDEPTTHLDIHSREALEDALADYDGTLVVVSHDVEFVRRVANRILAITPPGITTYPGGYQDYQDWLARAQRSEPAPSPDQPSPSTPRKIAKRERAELIQRTNRRKRELEEQIQTLENRIHQLEQEQHDLVACLGAETAASDFARINQRLSSLPSELAQANHQWEQASLELESLIALREQGP